ncbi:MAG: Gfo/Idh/MocA family oxidoreductase, partial [Candidatus Marinimicrobia bacterium]|nr:Gfo/Idh/MocA family oxidoreductase [Candidatus Neomarinimicrobiota bacterium]
MPSHQVGIIGYGGFGRYLHQAWDSHDNVTVTGISDHNPDVYSGPVAFHRHWEHLLDDRDITIVAIATPPSTHCQIAVAAMERGKHVLIEKPLATGLTEARKIMACQEQTGVVAGVDYMLRYNMLIKAVDSLQKTGCLGTLRRIAVENYASDETVLRDHWLWDESVSGGLLVEHAVHFLDLANFLTGSTPAQVTGYAAARPDGREDRVFAAVQHDNGVTATHYHDFSRPGFFERTEIRLIYDLAEIELQGWIPLAGRIRVLVNAETK